MGEAEEAVLRVDSDNSLTPEFHGAKVASDARLVGRNGIDVSAITPASTNNRRGAALTIPPKLPYFTLNGSPPRQIPAKSCSAEIYRRRMIWNADSLA